MLVCPLPDRFYDAIRERRSTWQDESRRRREEFVALVRSHEGDLRANRCSPPLLDELANVYFGGSSDVRGHDPHDRLRGLFGDETDLMDTGTYDDTVGYELAVGEYVALASLVVLPLLRSFSVRRAHPKAMAMLDELFISALCHVDRATFVALIAKKLACTSMSSGQRVRWLAVQGIRYLPGVLVRQGPDTSPARGLHPT